jgi:hypothetical protein
MQRRAPRAMSVPIESERGSGFLVLTRFLDANRPSTSLENALVARHEP